MRTTHVAIDGKITITDDGIPDPVAPPDPAMEIAALKAEVERLKAGLVTVAQQPAAMTKADAEALVKATKAKG